MGVNDNFLFFGCGFRHVKRYKNSQPNAKRGINKGIYGRKSNATI